jgi:hypothetical protein
MLWSRIFFNADPDPAQYLNADPDPAFYFHTDPGPNPESQSMRIQILVRLCPQ